MTKIAKMIPFSVYTVFIVISVFQIYNIQTNVFGTLRTQHSIILKDEDGKNTSDLRTLHLIKGGMSISNAMTTGEQDINDSPEKIVKISVLGERHSGTTWVWEHLKECYEPNLKINRRLTRYKHWFQYDDGQEHEKTLVISLFRDPYYWVEAMRKIPHHASAHINLKWKEFVTQPWTMPRVGKDLEISNNMTSRICQERFYFNEVISCNKYPYPDGYFKERPDYSAHQPLYELRTDGSGEPYSNILELRSAKIKNFFEIIKNMNYVHDFWPFRYEDMIQNGTEKLLQDIEKVTGIKANCKPSPPQHRNKRTLDSSFVSWINEHLDWNVEKMIGYYKMPSIVTVAEQ